MHEVYTCTLENRFGHECGVKYTTKNYARRSKINRIRMTVSLLSSFTNSCFILDASICECLEGVWLYYVVHKCTVDIWFMVTSSSVTDVCCMVTSSYIYQIDVYIYVHYVFVLKNPLITFFLSLYCGGNPHSHFPFSINTKQ
jgi:hypothetical protein